MAKRRGKTKSKAIKKVVNQSSKGKKPSKDQTKPFKAPYVKKSPRRESSNPEDHNPPVRLSK